MCVCARAHVRARKGWTYVLEIRVCVCARALYVRACVRMHVGAFVCVQDGLDKVSVVTDWKP